MGFSHPSNRKYTGTLFNFKKMMYSNNYSLILNHIEHNIISVRKDKNTSFFFVEIVKLCYFNYSNCHGYFKVLKFQAIRIITVEIVMK